MASRESLISHSLTSIPVVESPLYRSEIWFQDGTIVLQAGSTLFRVYDGVLSMNSPTLKAMLTKSKRDAEEVIENCLIIHVTGSAADWHHFLLATHNAGYYDPSKNTDFAVLAGVLRLSTKYKVPYLRQRAIQQLSTIFPTTLEEWDKRDHRTLVSYFPARPIEAVNLARATGIPAFLPAALCSACWTGIDGIITGLPSFDGSHVELNDTDKGICARAREDLIVAQRTRLLKFLLPTQEDIFYTHSCPTPNRCDSKRLKWLRWWDQEQGGGLTTHPFLIPFSWDEFQRDVCVNCATVSKRSFELARQALWDDLPSFFGLPSWEVLRKSLGRRL